MARTGLRTITSRHAFAVGVKRLRTRWTLRNMTAAKRADYLVALANRVLGKHKVPAVTYRFEGQGSPFSGEFDHEFWRVDLDNRGFSQRRAPSINDLAELADSVYHECRHAEQWFLICRLFRTHGATAKFLTETGISSIPAERAGTVPLQDGTDESKLAWRLRDCLMVNKGRERIMQTQNDLDILSGGTRATRREIQEARNRLIRMGYLKRGGGQTQVRRAAHNAYKFQFAEADAWDTGRLAKELYCRLERRPAPPRPIHR